MTQFASFLGVPFSDLSVTGTALWDNRRKHHVGAVTQAAVGFIFQVQITSDQSVEKVIEVFRKAEDGCYASDIIRSLTPMRAHLSLNGEEVLVDKRGPEIPDIPRGEMGWHHR